MELNQIKKTAIVSLVTDDELMEKLVLKGGNAIALVYGLDDRYSMDIDFSIDGDFTQPLDVLKERMEKHLQTNFGMYDYVVFDVKLTQKPDTVEDDPIAFWGGYELAFKIIEREIFDHLKDNIGLIQKRAAFVSPDKKRVFRIDFSKHEFCRQKQMVEIEGYTLHIYSVDALVIEKLRAICQQHPEYRKRVQSLHRSPRARDFFDIYLLMEKFTIDLLSESNRELFQGIFAAKQVPLNLLEQIEPLRDFHRQDYSTLENTVSRNYPLQAFDYYFDYVLNVVSSLKSFWEEQAPTL